MVKNNNVYNKEYKSKLKVEVLEVQTNSKLNQGEVIKVGVLKKEKISGMPA
jgi:hypothetical protein